MAVNSPPDKTPGDAAAAVTRAGLSAIPLIGGPAVELFNALVTPPLERRREEWMRTVGEDLARLEADRGIRIEELRANPVFVDTLLQASHSAVRTHHAEKHEALRAAVLNAALPEAPEEALQQMFVAWIGDLTAWHLRILRFFHDPPGWMAQNGRGLPSGGSSLDGMLLAAYPDLQGKRLLYDQIWTELWQRGLANTDTLHTMMSSNGTLARRSSDLGGQFLAFITAPKVG